MIKSENSTDFEIGRARPHDRCRSPYVTNEEEIVGPSNSLDTLKTKDDVDFMDADVCFKIKVGRQIAVELHPDVRKNQTPTVLLHSPRLFPETPTGYEVSN